jgi:hypothetical protein
MDLYSIENHMLMSIGLKELSSNEGYRHNKLMLIINCGQQKFISLCYGFVNNYVLVFWSILVIETTIS